MKIDLSTHQINVIDEGPRNGAPLVMLHALGTGAHLWDEVVAHMPPGLRIIRPDLRGHRDSTAPAPPFKMGSLVRDVERVLDHLEIKDTVVVGLSIGGMIAQGLAVKRLDLVRGLVLANSAARVGIAAHWEKQIEEIRAKGASAYVGRVFEGWFTLQMRETAEAKRWRTELMDLSDEMLIGYLEALKTTDFYTPTSGLRLPTLGLASFQDHIIPPDMTRETVALIPGSETVILRKSAHLCAIDQAETVATHICNFLNKIGHI